eukprot:6178325-Pleurochrysis_carterae.AAC.11
MERRFHGSLMTNLLRLCSSATSQLGLTVGSSCCHTLLVCECALAGAAYRTSIRRPTKRRDGSTGSPVVGEWPQLRATQKFAMHIRFVSPKGH